MSPSTVHLNAQLIRHGRGMITALEKWTDAQPPGAAVTELKTTIAVWRGMLTVVEQQISAQDTSPVPAVVARAG